MINADKKRTQILEAAMRRFAHFGMAKTTMAEIAQDLSFSKALLYYYFPDKNALYAAVLEHVIDQSFGTIEAALPSIDDCEQAIMFILDKRIEFVMNYYNLLEHAASAVQQTPDEMARVMEELKDKEITLISQILQKGAGTGQLQIDNARETAEIMLYALAGMRFSLMKDLKGGLFPTKAEFDRILVLQKKMATIFLRGLRKQSA
ncbi:TetR/AcrR family transcriptional regulator, mexJK operon transcriptional repressor [Parapedobacter composti]|uniref:TetR/AcrR family transcriptional regulator, mexJK operon transcriptional repressor n=1 Tax=Parapedobacter composti TaxID=623281 RepID=A0A1I1M832_9SPHI|nr:TetR/AcrR family transcriptional regulator [Parapedobacter composti]SFC81375.1 TetR/AcrR family transcriptional regulator, mexJK operon transcriptional repressor [Parapedobacter composti]